MLRSACFDTKRIKISGPPLYVLPRIIVLGSSRGHFGCCSFPDHFFLTFLRSSCLSMFSPGSFFQCSSQDRFFLRSSPFRFPMFFPGSFSHVFPRFVLSHLFHQFTFTIIFPRSFFPSSCLVYFVPSSSPVHLSNVLSQFVFSMFSPVHFSKLYLGSFFPTFFPASFF